MQKVLRWEKGVERYKKEDEKIKIEKPERCKKCGCKKFHKWGKYERYIISEEGDERIKIRRIRCVKCGKTYSYLPSFCISGMCYSLDFVIKILKALILKIKFSFGDLRRRAYEFLRRFLQSENLFVVFLRAKGVWDFHCDRQKRLKKILKGLLKFYENGSLLSEFLKETGQHFLSAK
jgi:hypothetical protein